MIAVAERLRPSVEPGPIPRRGGRILPFPWRAPKPDDASPPAAQGPAVRPMGREVRPGARQADEFSARTALNLGEADARWREAKSGAGLADEMDPVDRAAIDSFPASDPPAWIWAPRRLAEEKTGRPAGRPQVSIVDGVNVDREGKLTREGRRATAAAALSPPS